MKDKRIMIRADGNAKIGAGHLMRCLTIADALAEKTSVEFVCADEASAELAREHGYEADVLGTDYTDMESELPAWTRILKEKNAVYDKNAANSSVVILVDSYYVTNAYLEQLLQFGKVVLLDDMAKTPWNVDAVINYNAFATQAMYERLDSPYDAAVYTGGRFIPVRKEFCSRSYVVRETVKNILITTGGGDCDNIAGQILEAIYLPECHYHIVTGRFNPHYDALMEIAATCHNVHIYHDVKNMAELMERCDLAVTAGGTTIYELSAVGVPFVCFSYAENQEKLTEYIGREQKAGYGGAFHQAAEQTLKEICSQIYALKEDLALRCRYSMAERALVDGQGAVRIAKILMGLYENNSSTGSGNKKKYTRK